MTHGSDLAYPFVETRQMQGESISFGLTKREHFASLALQGLLAAGGFGSPCKDAVDLADSLIAALNGETLSDPPPVDLPF